MKICEMGDIRAAHGDDLEFPESGIVIEASRDAIKSAACCYGDSVAVLCAKRADDLDELANAVRVCISGCVKNGCGTCTRPKPCATKPVLDALVKLFPKGGAE